MCPYVSPPSRTMQEVDAHRVSTLHGSARGNDRSKNADSGFCEVAPVIGKTGRKEWSPRFAPFGPIGLILVQSHTYAAAISPNFCIHVFAWPTMDVFECLMCELKPAINNLFKHARTRADANSRKSTTGLFAIDEVVANAFAKKTPDDELGLLRLIQQGATWDRVVTATTGYHDSNV